jgi:multidrug resistance efflux pump
MNSLATRIRVLLWLALAVAVVAVTACGQWIRYRREVLSSENEYIQQEMAKLAVAIQKDEALHRRAN